MATSNRRSATVHLDPPLPPSAATPLCITLFVIFTIISIPLFYVFVVEPYYPDFQIISDSATRLCKTTPSTWHLTLKISNPNLVRTIACDQVHVSVFYIGRDVYDYEAQMIAEMDLGPVVQKSKESNIFYRNLNISLNDLEGQKKGVFRYEIRITFGDESRMNLVICTDLTLVFNNSTGPGLSSDLPMDCALISVVRYYYY